MNQDFAPKRSLGRLVEKCLKTTVNHGNGGIMVLGTFLSSRVVELIRCDRYINAKECIDILEKGLLPSIDKLFSLVNPVDIIFHRITNLLI